MRSRWIRPLLRWLVGLGLVAAGLWGLKLSLFHAWVAGGPPTDYPEWHAHWAWVFLAVAVSLLLAGGLLLWLLRPGRRSRALPRSRDEPPEIG